MSDIKIKSYLNRGSHLHNDKVDFRTPPYLFHWIEENFGIIDYDAACVDGLNNLSKPLRLEEEWPKGSTIYSNPPFDSPSIEKWFVKGEIHAANGGVHIMCIPNKICQVFFSKMITRFDEIVFLGGRVNFISPYAVKGGASMSGTLITRQGGLTKYHDTPIIRGVLLSDMKKQYQKRLRP